MLEIELFLGAPVHYSDYLSCCCLATVVQHDLGQSCDAQCSSQRQIMDSRGDDLQCISLPRWLQSAPDVAEVEADHPGKQLLIDVGSLE